MQVLLCANTAKPQCASKACFDKYNFQDAGLSMCPMPTDSGGRVLGNVGDVYYLEFLVFDGAKPPNNATITRMVTIVNPCKGTDKPNYCVNDGPLGFECSAIGCQELEAVNSPISHHLCTTLSANVFMQT
jgi:hypothetical protein